MPRMFEDRPGDDPTPHSASDVHDVTDHRLHIAQHIGSVDAQHADLLQFEPLIPDCIALGLIAPAVDLPIHFDDERDLVAIEVEEIRPGAMLVAEFEAVGALLELAPQQGFGKSYFPSKLFGAGARGFRGG